MLKAKADKSVVDAALSQMLYERDELIPDREYRLVDLLRTDLSLPPNVVAAQGPFNVCLAYVINYILGVPLLRTLKDFVVFLSNGSKMNMRAFALSWLNCGGMKFDEDRPLFPCVTNEGCVEFVSFEAVRNYTGDLTADAANSVTVFSKMVSHGADEEESRFSIV